MKVLIEFNLPNEEDEYTAAVKGRRYLKIAEEFEERFFFLLDKRDVTIDEVWELWKQTKMKHLL